MRTILPLLAASLLLTVFGPTAHAGRGGAEPTVIVPAAAAASSPVVTLHVKDAPVNTVLAQITAQTGARLGPPPAPARGAGEEPKVTLDVDEQQFWMVLREISRQTGLNTPAGTGAGVAVIPLARGGVSLAERPMCLADGFLITTESASRMRAVLLDSGGTGAALELRLLIHAPPGQRLLGAALPVVTEARLSGGRSLALATSPAGATGGSLRWITPIAVALDPRSLGPGERLAVLRGTIRVATEGPGENWTIESPFERRVEHKLRTGETVTVAVTRAGDGMSVSVETGAEDVPLLQVIGQTGARLRLFDGQNREGEAGDFARTAAGFTRRFPEFNGLPSRVVIDLPPLRTLTFEFKDLPLP